MVLRDATSFRNLASEFQFGTPARASSSSCGNFGSFRENGWKKADASSRSSRPPSQINGEVSRLSADSRPFKFECGKHHLHTWRGDWIGAIAIRRLVRETETTESGAQRLVELERRDECVPFLFFLVR